MINEELQEKLLSVFDKRFENYNTKQLQEHGFDIEIDNWDKEIIGSDINVGSIGGK